MALSHTGTIKIEGAPTPGSVAISEKSSRCGGALVAAALGQLHLAIAQIELWSGARKQGHGQCRHSCGGEAIDHRPHPGIHAEYLRQHENGTFT